jgi:hypothetical protein
MVQHDIKDLFKSPKYVNQTILEARGVFSSNDPKKWNAAEKSLGLAYLYCPEEMRDLVYATLYELNIRKGHMEFKAKLQEIKGE